MHLLNLNLASMFSAKKVTHFKTVKSMAGPEVRIEDIFDDILNGKYMDQVEEIRQNPGRKDELKKNLPAFTLSAT